MRPELELRLAWRNVWRSPRRTALTLAATVFAVFLCVVFVAMADGTHGKLVEDSVRLHSGHVMLAAEGYLEDRSLEHALVLDTRLERVLDGVPGLEGWAPRVTGFVLVSRDETSRGAAVIGVSPRREPRVSTWPGRVGEGRFLDLRPRREVLLGRRLAEGLGAGVGDEVLLFGIAYTLESAYDLYRVAGLLDLPEPELERRLAVIHLDDARDFFVVGDRVSEIALLASDARAGRRLGDELRQDLAAAGLAEAGSGLLRVHPWQEVLPGLEQYLFLDRAGMVLMLAVLVVVAGFGILNTILMAVLERARELAIMGALGLRPAAIFRVVYLESMLLAVLGLGLGLALALPPTAWMVRHPIPLPGEWEEMTELVGAEPLVVFALEPGNPWLCARLILGVALVAGLYPAWKASRGRPADALRSL